MNIWCFCDISLEALASMISSTGKVGTSAGRCLTMLCFRTSPLFQCTNLIYYRPQTKFGEGNVFTGVYLFMGVGYPGHWRGHMVGYALPSSRHGTWIPPPMLLTPGGHHWRLAQNCSLEHLHSPAAPGYWHLILHFLPGLVKTKKVLHGQFLFKFCDSI